MDSEKPHSIGSIATRIVCTLLVLLLLYVLSFGPACLIGDRFDSRPVVGKLYRPIFRVIDDTPLHDPVWDYIAWWIRLGEGNTQEPEPKTPPTPP